MGWIGGQRYLSYEEALNNMNIAYPILKKDGWSDEAIFGWGGNAWRESHVNPTLIEFGGGGGGGIVQWTPWSKHVNWANARGIDPNDGNGQIEHIIYEKNNNIQWFPNPIADIPYMSWKEFTQLKDIDVATKAFMYFYEHPGVLELAERLEYAHKFAKDVDGSGVDDEGYQLAVLPIHYINVTQSEFTPDFSHAGTEAVDMAGEHPRYPLYAPCDIVCTGVDRSEAFVNWTSQKEVRCVDGTISFINFHIGHDDTHTQYNVGDTFKKGELFGHTGNSGHSFGDHLHIEVGKHKFEGMWSGGGLPNPAKLWDVFSSCDNVTKKSFPIINAGGIPWKCDLNWTDGAGGNNGGEDKTEDDYITLLLCDTLNGWKW